MGDHLTEVSASVRTLLAREDLTDQEWRDLLAVQATVAVAEQLAAIVALLKGPGVLTEHDAPAADPAPHAYRPVSVYFPPDECAHLLPEGFQCGAPASAAEHAAPPVEEAPDQPSGITVHPFTPASPHRIACMAPAVYGAVHLCGQREDAAVHRVEQLTDKQRDLLENLLQTGPRIGVSTSLVDLGLAEHISTGYVVSARGRAWLVAHPREGGAE